jgi:hypothetical protein
VGLFFDKLELTCFNTSAYSSPHFKTCGAHFDGFTVELSVERREGSSNKKVVNLKMVRKGIEDKPPPPRSLRSDRDGFV